MKKSVSLLALLLALMLPTTACGAASADTATQYASEAAAAMPEADLMTDPAADDAAAGAAEGEVAGMSASRSAAPGEAVTEGTVDLSEKIIYSAQAQIETTDYESSIAAVEALIDRYNAFLEASSINGNNLMGGASVRSASYILRVPRENYAAITGALDTVGNVTYLTSTADNITAQYTDTQSRLSAYEVEEERLLEILSKAETVEDMIDLESRLGNVRYEKEALTSQLQNWDNQVAYSTVDIFIQEVEVLTPEPEEEKTYWQQVSGGFISTLRAMGRGAKALLRLFVAALPVLIVIALVTLITVLLARRGKSRRQPPTDSSGQDKPKP